MTTAFQPNAFQNNVFQIDLSIDTHDGVDSIPKFHLPVYLGKDHRKQEFSNIIRIYDKAKELGEADRLISIIEPFIEAKTPEEIEKRSTAKRIVDKLPDIQRINMEYLVRNQLAIDLLLDELERVKLRLINEKLLSEEDDLLLILLSSCV